MGFSRSADGTERAALIQDLLEPCGLGGTLTKRHNDHPEQEGEIAAAPLSSIHSKTQKRACRSGCDPTMLAPYLECGPQIYA